MRDKFMELVFTPTVQARQSAAGSREHYETYAAKLAAAPPAQALSDAERAFIEGRDSFYMATVSETGWPYVQHRGGPAGFVKVLGPTTIGFADFRGNRQYISAGNMQTDDRVSLFFMDYPGQRRLKLLGHARAVDAGDAVGGDLLDRLVVSGYAANAERAVVIEVAAFDWNCPQHITRRYSQADVEEIVAKLQMRIADLEARLGDAVARPG